MATINIESTTWLDLLPTEIIFLIFNYLSSNDIIYTFFFFNQRFNNLLLQNQNYLRYFELSSTDLNTWENIFSMIGSRIECLNITTIDLLFPLKYFPNIKSLIISSPFGFADEELKSLIESEQFQNLHSFKIKEEQLFLDEFHYNNLFEDSDLFKRIFNHKNSLETLKIPLYYRKNIDNLEINLNLRSMTLITISFENIFSLIEFTPNLEYLNVNSNQPHRNQPQISIDKTNIKLKKLCLTLRYHLEASESFHPIPNYIRQFSTSLTCLSLNLVHAKLSNLDEIPFSSRKFQQFLESMIKLKEFHLYAKVVQSSFVDPYNILSGFKNEYWFDHNWSFGMHLNYFYTLPFHFDYLYKFYNFNIIDFTNDKMMKNNPRIWYNIKFIELFGRYTYDGDFVEKLKIKMPKLNLIRFHGPSSGIDCSREIKYTTLDNVTTIESTNMVLEDIYGWMIYFLPNLKHLKSSCTLSDFDVPELLSILNKRIQRLDIDVFYSLKQLAQTSYVYFSNVQYINFCLNDSENKSELYASVLMKILTNFKNLKSLLIYNRQTIGFPIDPSYDAKLIELIEYLDMNSIRKTYKLKLFRRYALIFKTET